MKDFVKKLFRHVAWADQKTLEAIRATPTAHPEALPLPLMAMCSRRSMSGSRVSSNASFAIPFGPH
ncbi:MAG: hypothetical protein K2X38_09315 [Gemmataceae bacterium]|nr:hypothetical protein [Gemmataceae bacterium]